MEDSNNKTAESWLIVLELLLGVVLSIFYLKLTLFGDYSLGNSFLGGVINFYTLLSLLFFFAVFSIGIIGAIKFKQSRKVPKAIFYSVIFWIMSILISVMLSEIPFLSIYLILIAIVVGFNIGLRQDS